jgi:hypothetical protein
MKTLLKWSVVASAVASTAAAPAAANPIPPGPEPESSSAVLIATVAVGGVAAAFATYMLYRHAEARRPSFVAEDVTITLSPARAKVEGIYRFRNPADKTQPLTLRYPFARGSALGEPENVVVRDADGEDVPFSWEWRDVAFEVTVPPRGEAEVAVSYEQGCRGDEFTYVLTSTRRWRRPLEDAYFAVDVPPQLAPLKGSYELEEVASRDGFVRYELRRDDFYPDVDLNLRWRRADSEVDPPAWDALSEAPPPAAGD